MIRKMLPAALLLLASPVFAQPPMAAAAPQPVSLVLENQFDQKVRLEDYRGGIVILVYGDRKGTEACRMLGEMLHVTWHPEAKGQPPAIAHAAAVVPLREVAPGKPSPDVRVIPVACCGKVPGPIRGAIRSQIAKGSPEVPVWLDFGDMMKTTFGLTAGEQNVVVFDAAGRLRMKINGTLDQPAMDRLVDAVQRLRYEAVR